METINNHQVFIDQLNRTLSDKDMAVIDFDELKKQLDVIGPLLSQADRLRSDYALLHDDLVGRISGMMKAVAAVERSDAGLESIAEYLETLPSMPADELIRQYGRVSARFREAFGTSFANLRAQSGNRQAMEPALYK